MQFTTTTTLFILVAVIGTSAMVVMVQAQGASCAEKGWISPALSPHDPKNACEINDNCCDGDVYCQCGNEGFICAIDDRPKSALSCHTVGQSMSNDTSSFDEYLEVLIDEFIEEVSAPDFLTSSRHDDDEEDDDEEDDDDDDESRSAVVTATSFLVTAATVTFMGGIDLL